MLCASQQRHPQLGKCDTVQTARVQKYCPNINNMRLNNPVLFWVIVFVIIITITPPEHGQKTSQCWIVLKVLDWKWWWEHSRRCVQHVLHYVKHLYSEPNKYTETISFDSMNSFQEHNNYGNISDLSVVYIGCAVWPHMSACLRLKGELVARQHHLILYCIDISFPIKLQTTRLCRYWNVFKATY